MKAKMTIGPGCRSTTRGALRQWHCTHHGELMGSVLHIASWTSYPKAPAVASIWTMEDGVTLSIEQKTRASVDQGMTLDEAVDAWMERHNPISDEQISDAVEATRKLLASLER